MIFKYNQDYDVETSIYYCKARYYIPRWGRWLTPDNPRYLEPGNINGLNLFVYCNNSPIFMIDREGMYPIKLNNKLDKHKYIVDSNDGSQGYYNKKVDGTTDFTWNVSNSLVTIFNMTDERIHSLYEYTRTIIINRFAWIGESYDLLISLMTKSKEDETKQKDWFIITTTPSIEGSGNVNDRTVLTNMATSYSGINSSYGGCMKVYFEQQPFIYEDIRMRMW